VLSYIINYIPKEKKSKLDTLFKGNPIEKIEELRKKLNLPSLSELGFSKTHAQVISENAFKLRKIVNLCPRRVDINKLKKIVEHALQK